MTAMLVASRGTGQPYMKALDALAIPALDMSVTSQEECNIVRAFVMHVVDNVRPDEIDNPFLQMVLTLTQLQGYEKITAVCAFINSGGGAGLLQSVW
jgi:hypothetical protein